MRGGQPDQASLFDAGKNLDAQAGLLLYFLNKLRGVVGFADRGSGDSKNRFRLVCLGNRLEPLNATDRGVNCRAREATPAQGLVAQADYFFFSSEDRKRIANGGVRDREFDRIRADVYCCESQWSGTLRNLCYRNVNRN